MIIGRAKKQDGSRYAFVHDEQGACFVTLYNQSQEFIPERTWTEDDHKFAEYAESETIKLWDKHGMPDCGFASYYVNTGKQWRGNW